MDSSIYRMRLRDVLTVCVFALLALGAIMVQSASTSLNGAIVHAAAEPTGGNGSPAASSLGSPPKPVNVAAAVSGDGIDLSWSPDRNADVVAYRVYRGSSSATAASEFTLLETLRKPHSRYHDTDAPKGLPSIYRVSALDEAGKESTPTVLSATRPGMWQWNPLASKNLIYVGLAMVMFIAVGRFDYRQLAPCGEESRRA